MKKLNDKQREFITQNHNLIYSFLYANKLDVDDWYDVAAIGLCKSVLMYDNSKSKFSTYTYKCMWNQVHIEMRKQNAIRRADDNAVLYYDAMLAYNDDGDECSFLNLIPDLKYDTGKQAMIRIALYDVFRKLNDKEQSVLRLLARGYRQREVATLTSYSQAYVSRIQKKARLLCQY